MTRHQLIDQLAQSLALVELTPFGRASFDWKRMFSPAERRHYRDLARAAFFEIERLLEFHFARGTINLKRKNAISR